MPGPGHPWVVVPFTLPAPVALARHVDELPMPGGRPLLYEPKWDGWRCITTNGRLFSRTGTDLTRLFPDLAPVLSSRMPLELVADGELVVWDPQTGRLDFDALQARATAGNRLRSVASRRPAQFVAFDALAADGVDLRSRPLQERRAVLEQHMSGLVRLTVSPVGLRSGATFFAVLLGSTVVAPAISGRPSASVAPGKARASVTGAVAGPVKPTASMSTVALALTLTHTRCAGFVG